MANCYKNINVKIDELNNRIRVPFNYVEKYPKFLLLFITFLVAYLIFQGRNFSGLHNLLISLNYLGFIIAGVMYSYGFTAAPSTAIFLILSKQENILLAGLLGGIGSLVGDLVIFSLIRSSFSDEIERLSHEKIVRYLTDKTPKRIKSYVLPVLGSLIIASPLPDEIGITMLAATKKISAGLFMFLSYTLNTLGILAILYIGRAI